MVCREPLLRYTQKLSGTLELAGYGLPGTASEIHSSGFRWYRSIGYGLPGTASEIHF